MKEQKTGELNLKLVALPAFCLSYVTPASPVPDFQTSEKGITAEGEGEPLNDSRMSSFTGIVSCAFPRYKSMESKNIPFGYEISST